VEGKRSWPNFKALPSIYLEREQNRVSIIQEKIITKSLLDRNYVTFVTQAVTKFCLELNRAKENATAIFIILRMTK
jgi:hypothetical protein